MGPEVGEGPGDGRNLACLLCGLIMICFLLTLEKSICLSGAHLSARMFSVSLLAQTLMNIWSDKDRPALEVSTVLVGKTSLGITTHNSM